MASLNCYRSSYDEIFNEFRRSCRISYPCIQTRRNGYLWCKNHRLRQTVGDLAQALLELFEVDNEIKIIGTRHGEKEKKQKHYLHVKNMPKQIWGTIIRVPADSRDLNYSNYVDDGSEEITKAYEYNSDNTYQLSVSEVKEKLLTLDYVKNELKAFKNIAL